ncbi:MAG: hypothetical protein WCS85_01985 [Candidatus Peribacteraceae bacterium]|jgi:hypothetical protein
MMKKLILAAMIIVLALAGYFAYGFFSSPREPARQEQGNRTPRTGEFSNGQLYSVFAADTFEVKYPNWPNVDSSALSEPGRTKVAVSNEGCTFIITANPVPEGKTFTAFVEEKLREQTGKAGIRMTVKDISERSAHLETEISAGTVTIQSATYAYETSGRQYYGIGFAALTETFKRVCQPLIQDVIGSVRVH